jgi:hypothetical protein
MPATRPFPPHLSYQCAFGQYRLQATLRRRDFVASIAADFCNCDIILMELKVMVRHNDGLTVSTNEGRECDSCPEREKCTKGKKRTVAVDSREPFREKMRAKLRSGRGRETYMKRQGIVEPVHGDDQQNKGWRQHHLRGEANGA